MMESGGGFFASCHRNAGLFDLLFTANVLIYIGQSINIISTYERNFQEVTLWIKSCFLQSTS